jgi:hypothetical protein
MANIAIQDGTGTTGGNMPMSAGHMSVQTALRLAWATWVTLLIIPFLVFLGAVWALMGHEPAVAQRGSDTWFLGASAYLLVVVPISFFWRGRQFKSYWSGQPIEPRKYLYGMLGIWTALEFGGIISLLGCFVERGLLPNLLPALVAFMFYVTLWPSGRSMVRRVGDLEDPGVYEEPR